jgi:hypothetical protein
MPAGGMREGDTGRRYWSIVSIVEILGDPARRVLWAVFWAHPMYQMTSPIPGGGETGE